MKRHLLLLLVTLAGCSKGPTFIRVQNDTGHDFEQVIVVTNLIGAVRARTTSEYRQVALCYSDPTVLTRESNGVFHNRKHISQAEHGTLGDGHFTVILTLDQSRLDVKMKRD